MCVRMLGWKWALGGVDVHHPNTFNTETLQCRSRSRRPMFGLVFPFLSKTDVNAHAVITRVLIVLTSTTSLCSHTLGQY